jgi:hypothetical protein
VEQSSESRKGHLYVGTTGIRSNFKGRGMVTIPYVGSNMLMLLDDVFPIERGKTHPVIPLPTL